MFNRASTDLMFEEEFLLRRTAVCSLGLPDVLLHLTFSANSKVKQTSKLILRLIIIMYVCVEQTQQLLETFTAESEQPTEDLPHPLHSL